MGGSVSPGKLSIFSVKLDAPCCVHAFATRLPAYRAAAGTSLCTPDVRIDAERHESVIRTTLLRYTGKSHGVNVLVCGFHGKTVEETRVSGSPKCTPK